MAEVGQQTPETEMFKHEIEQYGDKCGVFGVYEPGSDVALTTYSGLYNLKHRGQDASGIVVINPYGALRMHKELGRVNEVFDEGIALPTVLPSLGNLAIGHVRYGTMSRLDKEKRWHAAQPIVKDENGFSIAGAYNGDVANIHDVATKYNIDHDAYVSDTEAVMQLLDQYMVNQEDPQLVEALHWLLPQLEGAVSGVFTDGKQLIATRDKNGFRPLVLGQKDSGAHVVASEIHALQAEGVQAEFINEVEPGTMLIVDEDGLRTERFAAATESPCSYEYFYFSKEDNQFHGQNIGDVRTKLGEELAYEQPKTEVDFWVGVPNSGVTAAKAYADALDISYVQAIQKNPNFAVDSRSFIANSQSEREAITRNKILVDAAAVDGKIIGVSDDSIIRGTVKKVVIEMLREAGAKEVHVRIPAPPYKYSCRYGMDTGRSNELLTYGRTYNEMVEELGADSLAFLSPDGVRRAIGRTASKLCLACSTGNYPTPVSIAV